VLFLGARILANAPIDGSCFAATPPLRPSEHQVLRIAWGKLGQVLAQPSV
jgi:hypothetical protein